MKVRFRFLTAVLLPFVAVACSSAASTKNSCQPTEPKWIMRPEDAAVPDPSMFGYYFVNEDQSIWASAWQARSW